MWCKMYRGDCVGVSGMIIALLTVAAVACVIFSGPQLDEGVVIGKRYEPEETRLYWRKTGEFGYWQSRTDDEDWILRVQGETAEGKAREEDWEVSKEQWEAAQIGDHVTRGAAE